MKCTRFTIEDLKNEEWFQFFTEFKDLIEQYGASALDIDALFATFLALYADADEALEIIRKSPITEQLADADSRRDGIFRGFADAVKSALNHFNPAKREAAKRLHVTFDHYGNIARKPYDEETASIYNFIQDMNGANAAEIDILGLNDWVVQLEVDNKAFAALMKNRDAEGAGKTELRMKDVRTEADRCYRDILDRFDALVIVNGKDKYAPLMKELGVVVNRYNNKIAQRKGRAAKSKKEDGQS